MAPSTTTSSRTPGRVPWRTRQVPWCRIFAERRPSLARPSLTARRTPIKAGSEAGPIAISSTPVSWAPGLGLCRRRETKPLGEYSQPRFPIFSATPLLFVQWRPPKAGNVAPGRCRGRSRRRRILGYRVAAGSIRAITLVTWASRWRRGVWAPARAAGPVRRGSLLRRLFIWVFSE